MNASQLLLGLSILIPASAYGAAHAPTQDSIKVIAHICDLKEAVYQNETYYRDILPEPPLCYRLTYWWRRPGLVFVQMDTLQGPFFGFTEITLYDYQSLVVEAYKDLVKNLKWQYRGDLGIDGYFNLKKTPLKLNN